MPVSCQPSWNRYRRHASPLRKRRSVFMSVWEGFLVTARHVISWGWSCQVHLITTLHLIAPISSEAGASAAMQCRVRSKSAC